MVLPRDLAERVGFGTPTFMDWSRTPSQPTGEPASFLYVQPVDQGILIEETVLATARPPREVLGILEQRLWMRGDATASQDNAPLTLGDLRDNVVTTERVAIPMGTAQPLLWRSPRRLPDGALSWSFGARGGLINPVTGYSIAAAMSAADELLDRIEGARLPRATACNRVAAHALRRLGAHLIDRGSSAATTDFFDAFFSLPTSRQLGYLIGHNGAAVAHSMWALRTHTGWRHDILSPLWTHPVRTLGATARAYLPRR